MLFLVYLSVFFVFVCIGIYLMMNLKKNDNSVSEQPVISHNIDQIKTVIPDFQVPEANTKRPKENDRNQQFNRTLKRIIGVDIEEDQDLVLEKESNLENIIVEENEVNTVRQEFNHNYYQELLKNKEIQQTESSEDELFENMKKEKINNLLKKAADISSIEQKEKPI